MKQFTEAQVEDIIKLKYGQLVSHHRHQSFVSNRILGQIFGVSGSQIRLLYLGYFEKVNARNASLLTRLRSLSLSN